MFGITIYSKIEEIKAHTLNFIDNTEQQILSWSYETRKDYHFTNIPIHLSHEYKCSGRFLVWWAVRRQKTRMLHRMWSLNPPYPFYYNQTKKGSRPTADLFSSLLIQENNPKEACFTLSHLICKSSNKINNKHTICYKAVMFATSIKLLY